MADRIIADLTGDKELQRAFKKLADKAQRTVGRKANRAGSTPVMKRMKALAGDVSPGKHGSGGLKKSIKRRFKRYGGVDVSIVGPDITGPHAHLVEYGTVERFTKEGVSRGIMPPRPFMRPAWAQTKNVAKRKGVDAMKKAIDTEARKAGQR
jgi:HK97 gp10 family phage protein